jgi:hypothetical protein
MTFFLDLAKLNGYGAKPSRRASKSSLTMAMTDLALLLLYILTYKHIYLKL